MDRVLTDRRLTGHRLSLLKMRPNTVESSEAAVLTVGYKKKSQRGHWGLGRKAGRGARASAWGAVAAGVKSNDLP